MSAWKSRPGTAPSKMCDNNTLYPTLLNFISLTLTNWGLVWFGFFVIYILSCGNNHYHHFNTFKEVYGRLCWAINKLMPKILPPTEKREKKTRSCPFNNNVYHIKIHPKLIQYKHTYPSNRHYRILMFQHDGSDLFCIIITNINQVRKRL